MMNGGVCASNTIPSPVSRSTSPANVSLHAVEELCLLSDTNVGSIDGEHDLITAPVMTRHAYVMAGLEEERSQYGVLGSVLAIQENADRMVPEDPRLYVNTNAPFSAVVCGVQGSGKSHTVSVLLENMLIPEYSPIGVCKKTLCGLVLHFGEGGPSSRPNEAAWISQTTMSDVQVPSVHVYVSSSSLHTMKAVYAPLGPNVKVLPLLFSDSELDAEAFLSMMAVGSSDSAPLYMQTVLSILRKLGETFTYTAFTREMDSCKVDFNPAQLAGLKQRLALLEAFIDQHNKYPPSRFCEGQLTIIDLSDPFIDPAAACSLFEIATRIFVRADVGTGKVLVVDEAHKYLAANKGNSGLTRALLSLIRQQRHLAMRVVLSTQGKANSRASCASRFMQCRYIAQVLSPSWWEHIVKHVSAKLSDDAFDQVVKLRAGESIILAPAGFGVFSGSNGSGQQELCQFGRRFILAKTRKRVTADGGASILVMDG
ncbi:hypothetical protein A0H81_03799 [Grifola frondosa]|uniref:Zona occludens toxin N-terminal domain-containing protein n=1 Tax=Grifola frondosa TaxID=5627 RepID=A0A1C7MKM9_GRIFR|nr:hypothetical protein A0H81_03799 [Grifola frondosa]